jgi:hypothetical protein
MLVARGRDSQIATAHLFRDPGPRHPEPPTALNEVHNLEPGMRMQGDIATTGLMRHTKVREPREIPPGELDETVA